MIEEERVNFLDFLTNESSNLYSNIPVSIPENKFLTGVDARKMLKYLLAELEDIKGNRLLVFELENPSHQCFGIYQDGEEWIAFDNRTNECWQEEFPTEKEALSYLHEYDESDSVEIASLPVFEVEIVETLKKKVSVSAANYKQACQIVQNQYDGSEIVLTADDHSETRIDLVAIPPQYSTTRFAQYVSRRLVKLDCASVEEEAIYAFGGVVDAIESYESEMQ